MSRLLDEIRKDPDAVFEIEADLPSGNRMIGTIGPVINRKLAASVGFSKNPPSEEDIEFAKSAMNQMMGLPPAEVHVATREQAGSIVRKFFGGGKG